jgi:hypothetical protein
MPAFAAERLPKSLQMPLMLCLFFQLVYLLAYTMKSLA